MVSIIWESDLVPVCKNVSCLLEGDFDDRPQSVDKLRISALWQSLRLVA